jgi:hypothetical protein
VTEDVSARATANADGLLRLGGRLAGDVVLPGDKSWEAARQAWNTAADQRPIAVVLPESAEDVVEVVRFAGANGLRIAFIGGGHNAGTIDWSHDTLLLKTERMRGVGIDSEARRARVEAGTLGSPSRRPPANTAWPTWPAPRRTSVWPGTCWAGA